MQPDRKLISITFRRIGISVLIADLLNPKLPARSGKKSSGCLSGEYGMPIMHEGGKHTRNGNGGLYENL
jgi:hypothetical protein